MTAQWVTHLHTILMPSNFHYIPSHSYLPLLMVFKVLPNLASCHPTRESLPDSQWDLRAYLAIFFPLVAPNTMLILHFHLSMLAHNSTPSLKGSTLLYAILSLP